jgi:hypothetical protein
MQVHSCLAFYFQAFVLSSHLLELILQYISDYVAVSIFFATLPLFSLLQYGSYFASRPGSVRNREVRLLVVARRRNRGLAMHTVQSRVALAIYLLLGEQMQDSEVEAV